MQERIMVSTVGLFILLLLLMVFHFNVVTVSLFCSFLVMVGWLLLVLFFIFEREPRLFPVEGDFVVSPADGRVMKIVEEDGFDCIKIFMDLTDIHTQIMPYDGKIVDIKTVAGGYNRAYLEDAEHNMQVETKIETKLGMMKIKQLTGILVRRIKTYPKVGESLKRGEKFGRVTFGSNVFLYLPKGKTRILVAVNQAVVAGVTRLADPV